jgi:hypothetical protein
MGAFHRWRSWESGAHGHAYLSLYWFSCTICTVSFYNGIFFHLCKKNKKCFKNEDVTCDAVHLHPHQHSDSTCYGHLTQSRVRTAPTVPPPLNYVDRCIVCTIYSKMSVQDDKKVCTNQRCCTLF